MKDLISVIVPIYGVEKYISACIESIINQTYKNLEIILVDDGSLDNCPKIIDDFAQKDSRIKVIHKENGGVASARNAALSIATGTYFGFVDGDDTIDARMYETLMDLMNKHNSDVVMCSHQKVLIDENGNIVKEEFKLNITDVVMSKTETLKSMILDINVGNFACTKLFKSNLFEGITFPEGKVYEDAATTYRVIDRAQKIVYTNAPLYNYFYGRYGSITSNFTPKKILDSLDAYYDQYVFLMEKYGEIKDYSSIAWIKMYTSAMEKICMNNYMDLWNCESVVSKYSSFKKAMETVNKELLNEYLEPYRLISCILLNYDRNTYCNMSQIILNNIKNNTNK